MNGLVRNVINTHVLRYLDLDSDLETSEFEYIRSLRRDLFVKNSQFLRLDLVFQEKRNYEKSRKK